jgi:hypothetical protein
MIREPDIYCYYCGAELVLELEKNNIPIPRSWFVEQPQASCGCILAPTKRELIEAVQEYRDRQWKKWKEKNAD